MKKREGLEERAKRAKSAVLTAEEKQDDFKRDGSCRVAGEDDWKCKKEKKSLKIKREEGL